MSATTVQAPPATTPSPEAIAKCDDEYNKTVTDAGLKRDQCKLGKSSSMFSIPKFWGGKKRRSSKKGRASKKNKKAKAKKSKSQKKR
jgi:hypothetical protein